MSARSDGKPQLPKLKRGKKVAKKTQEVSTPIRTCGACKGKRCVECKNRGVVDVRMI